MSGRSSSGSWSGAGGAPPDIIDLDKFMRGAVRPARPDVRTMRCGDKLVVDAGGVDRKPGQQAAATPPPAPPAPSPLSDSSGSRAPPHGKHYSHDSGLSETSYARRKHRPHRRAVAGDSAAVRAPRVPAPAPGSGDSLRAFRAVCERALLDQQAQIARVAQLCERLSERPPARHRSERSERSERSATDTSEVSSSSRSTRDPRRKDKHRAEECKTYKIIMNKLDELNRLFAARARSSPPPALAVPPRRPPPVSSGSVSVSDKLVATEPVTAGQLDRRELLVAHNVVSMRCGSTYGPCGAGAVAGAGGSCGAGAGSRLSGLRAVTNTCALDIAPHDAFPRHNIATESVVQCDSRAATGTSGGDPRGFDLDDPVHLYSQAKRLQALSATTRRARSTERSTRRCEDAEQAHAQQSRAQSAARPRAERSRELSLCSLCRGYWRSLTTYIAAQLFCCPDTAVR